MALRGVVECGCPGLQGAHVGWGKNKQAAAQLCCRVGLPRLALTACLRLAAQEEQQAAQQGGSEDSDSDESQHGRGNKRKRSSKGLHKIKQRSKVRASSFFADLL